MIHWEINYKRLSSFWEAVECRKTLIKQIVAAVEDQFLVQLHDDIANNITNTILEISAYLFDNFVDTGSADVQREEVKVKDYCWNISDPPKAFFTIIEDL